MHIERIRLEHFRNIQTLEIKPNQGVNLIVGENASGKTNFCEAIYYTAQGRLLKGKRQRELINWEENYTRIEIETEKDHIKLVLDRESQMKRVEVNYQSVSTTGDMDRYLRSFIFVPDELQIIKGSPQGRRRFLNRSITALDREYSYYLEKYRKELSRKNALLKKERIDHRLLEVLNESLVETGSRLLHRRVHYLNELNDRLPQIYERLMRKKGTLRLKYLCSLDEPYQDLNIGIGMNEIRERYATRIEAVKAEERERHFSLVGPHRDDLRFIWDGVDMERYGSQGQQKLFIISIKVAQVELIQEQFTDSPILIIDDVISEFDQNRAKLLIENLPTNGQVFLTHTEVNDLLQRLDGDIYYMIDGRMTHGHR
ncbi:MAG: DNA replication/repair protein RecF [Candidatus Bipolaricaulia bacterium]